MPIAVEVVFGITMFTLQRFYKARLDQQRASVEIIFHANEMWVNCEQLLYLKGYYSFFGGPVPPLHEKMTQLVDEYQLLQKLVADRQEQARRLKKIWSSAKKALALGKKLQPLSSASLSASETMSALASNLQTLRRATRSLRQMSFNMLAFRDPKFLHSSVVIPEVERSTSQINRVVLGSLAASTLVSLLLFAYFIRSIDRDVKVLIENAERFKQGKELKDRATGTDELAQVDAAFREMADGIKEAQRAKQAIVSMISHDLRSPLTSVLGYFSSLRFGLLGTALPDTISGAESCERELERLIRLINDLLDLDKMDAGKFEIRPKALSVEMVIEQAIDAVAESAEAKGVTINGIDSSAEIYADPDRIVRAVANVLSTAVRLSSAGASVRTSVHQHEGQLEISIITRCASMSEQQLNSLFDRFQQKEAELALKLPVSKEIIKLHGGSIGATLADEAATFWLRLPVPPVAQN